ncbi:hypothetical protein GQ457_06G012200 [Hibiscus cannabinus]
MTAVLARVLGASVGKVIMTDTRLEDGNMGEFMRVRVLLDTSKPLRRCVVLSMPDAKASMCPLQYERLPLFCHRCGLIGHSVLVCPTTPKVEGQKFQYGAWLCAPLPKRSATRPRGRLSIVDDDLDAPVTVDSASEGPSVHLGSNGTNVSASAPDPVVPISTHKKHNWALIDRLRDTSPFPWLLGGDFNEILTFSEKQGGNRKPHHQLTDFRECLLRNDLADCKPSRGWFTWMKSGSRNMPIRERLDRFIADSAWFLTFPTFRAWSEYSPNSDHHFILLDTVAPPHATEARGKDSIFRFDDCWAREPDCISMVQSLWAHSTGSFSDRLATICEGLRHWQCTKRATEWERIPRLKSEINRLSSRRLSPQGLEVLLAAKGELSHLLKVQEAYWAQRSRVLWLSAGDQNTSFFHAKASARKKKNAIVGLYDGNGYWQTSTTEVLRVASDYFVSLFSANPPVDAPAFLEHISPSVTADMNSGLLASFTAEEVIAAFRDINPRKSPGIDGLPSGFFRQHWDILGEDFVSLCLDLLRGHTDMASVNETVIVLIPKVDKPTSMRQLRPISLCTVIYKTVSKMLVNLKISTAPARRRFELHA